MKKTLIAIAALAVVGAASAQVTLYGKIDATAKASTTGKSGAAPVADLTKYSIDSAGLSGSRWGVKGSEDLGGGLTASFQLEQGFSVDTGEASNTRQFHRQAYATLGGGFGSLSLGRQYGTIDNIPDNHEQWVSDGVAVRGAEKLATTLRNNRTEAQLFKTLATLVSDVEVGEISDWKWSGPTERFEAVCKQLNCEQLLKRLNVK